MDTPPTLEPPGDSPVGQMDMGITLALLALVCTVVWHISLLWLNRDAPSVLSGWLLTIFVLVVVTRQRARRVAPARRSWLMRHAVRLDGVGIVFVVFLLLLLLLFHMGFQRAASDGRAYFVQVRSLVMDWDLDFANDEAMFGGPSARLYAFGAPILSSPFFIASYLPLPFRRCSASATADTERPTTGPVNPSLGGAKHAFSNFCTAQRLPAKGGGDLGVEPSARRIAPHAVASLVLE